MVMVLQCQYKVSGDINTKLQCPNNVPGDMNMVLKCQKYLVI